MPTSWGSVPEREFPDKSSTIRFESAPLLPMILYCQDSPLNDHNVWGTVPVSEFDLIFRYFSVHGNDGGSDPTMEFLESSRETRKERA